MNNVTTDPLILWTNGGPGCSSMLGWSQEHGPYVNQDGEADGFAENPYTWNRNASVLYVDQPAGVGFSYCYDHKTMNKTNMPANCSFDDDSTAADNVDFIVNWFERNPSFKGNEFYLSGESYGGIYIPLLALNIVYYNNN